MNRPPRISVVTPSYNQASYLERTLRSVLDQGYPDLEYFVFDGGSTDGSREIIKSYEKRLTGSVCEPDNGQSDAINKGLKLATGDIICWLNSDDYFYPGTLDTVGKLFAENPSIQVIAGHVQMVDAYNTPLEVATARYTGLVDLACYWQGYHLHQSSIFWKKSLMDRVGLLDESLHLTMDFDLWLRFAEITDLHIVDQILSAATRHPDAKTGISYAPYKQAQRRNIWKRYGSPFSLRHWPIRLRFYKHLIKEARRNPKKHRSIYRG